MYARLFLPILYTSILAILFLLALVAGYTLSQEKLTEPVPFIDSGGVGTAASADPVFKAGKTIWNANACGSCHNRDMKSISTGPALAGAAARWAAWPRSDLRAWIRNSQQLIKAGHPRATELWAKWQPAVMSSYANLSDDEIEALLVYIDTAYH